MIFSTNLNRKHNFYLMGATKLKPYSLSTIRKAELAKAVSVPPRIIILNYLSYNHLVTGPTLENIIQLSQPTIHHHLATLISIGLIKGDFFGDEYCWYLNPDCATELKELSWFIDSYSDVY